MTGGTALEHASNQVVFLSSPASKRLEDDIDVGGRLMNRKYGRTVEWRVDKDRVGPGDGMSGEYDFHFAGENIGINRGKELITLGVEYGIIKKAGAWYSYDDERLGQGAATAAVTLLENDELYQRAKGQLYDRLFG